MGVHLDVSSDGNAGRLDVIEGPTGMRQRSQEERSQIATENPIDVELEGFAVDRSVDNPPPSLPHCRRNA